MSEDNGDGEKVRRSELTGEDIERLADELEDRLELSGSRRGLLAAGMAGIAALFAAGGVGTVVGKGGG